MSATNKADFEVGAVAHVSFRVRCERLGHGEEVFLVADSGGGGRAPASAPPPPSGADPTAVGGGPSGKVRQRNTA